MRFNRRQKHQIEGLITLVLFGVFAVCVLSVLLTGAKVYRNLTAEGQGTYAERTCAQYVASKVRQARSGDAVDVSTVDGTDVISFTEELDGETYVTRVYCSDGWLRELLTFEDSEFFPEDGEKIIEARELKLALDGGLLTADITDAGGETVRLVLDLRGRGADV